MMQDRPESTLHHASPPWKATLITLAVVMFLGSCAEPRRAAKRTSEADTTALLRDQRELAMNQRWRNRPLRELVAERGEPSLVMDIPGQPEPRSYVVLYKRTDGCIDAFAVLAGTVPKIRDYYCH